MNATATTKKALDCLKGMAEIVEAEMLIQTSYIEDVVSNPARIRAICGGKRSCAVGSLWVASGATLDVRGNLRGVEEEDRDDYLRYRPGLRLAYNALNEAARQYMDEHPQWEPHVGWSAPIEQLFEGNLGDPWSQHNRYSHSDEERLKSREALLEVIADARKRILDATE